MHGYFHQPPFQERNTMLIQYKKILASIAIIVSTAASAMDESDHCITDQSEINKAFKIPLSAGEIIISDACLLSSTEEQEYPVLLTQLNKTPRIDFPSTHEMKYLIVLSALTVNHPESNNPLGLDLTEKSLEDVALLYNQNLRTQFEIGTISTIRRGNQSFSMDFEWLAESTGTFEVRMGTTTEDGTPLIENGAFPKFFDLIVE